MMKSIDHILGLLEKEAKWEEHPLHQLLQLWESVVGSAVASHSRPVAIQRQVLWVATSSAAWAQNLNFSRRSLLLRCNQHLSTPLVDMRFSSASWHNLGDSDSQSQLTPEQHPSYLGHAPAFNCTVKSTVKNPDTVFRLWADTMQRRSQGLPLCPSCQCATPPGEIQRWQVCCVCASKTFSAPVTSV